MRAEQRVRDRTTSLHFGWCNRLRPCDPHQWGRGGLRSIALLSVMTLTNCQCGHGDGSTRSSVEPRQQASEVEKMVSVQPREFHRWDEIDKQLRESTRDIHRFEDIHLPRQDAYARWVGALDERSRGGNLAEMPDDGSVTVRWWTSAQSASLQLIELSENKTTAQGLPSMLWRVRGDAAPSSNAWVLQAPHRFFDKDTDHLAVRLFAEEHPDNADVLMLNTRHRYAQADGRKEKREWNPSDVCHNSGHPFTALTDQLWISQPHRRLVQLHGFGKRRIDVGGDAQDVLAIVSSGDRRGSSELVSALVAALREHFGGMILSYPEDIDELGATTNVQGRMLRRYADAAFVHIEMSSQMRRRLLDGDRDYTAFRDALFRVMGG